jgi:hypothetical protein
MRWVGFLRRRIGEGLAGDGCGFSGVLGPTGWRGKLLWEFFRLCWMVFS